ncbi:MAG TPA: hypothetical protein VFZ73_11660 [Gemmatimonadaceae bacterium]
MPDDFVEVGASSMLVEWDSIRLTGPGTLRLTTEVLLVEAEAGSVRAPYDALRGGAWRTGILTIHGERGSVAIQATHGLEHAWVQLTARACPLPELARSHRTLGSRRGGAGEAQARFLAPLLQARRRLNDVADLDARVAAMEAGALRERMSRTLQAIATDAFPASVPERRSLVAELEEALAGFFEGLQAMDAAAEHFRTAPESIRFEAWRAWMATTARTFALADTGWASAASLLPESRRP